MLRVKIDYMGLLRTLEANYTLREETKGAILAPERERERAIRPSYTYSSAARNIIVYPGGWCAMLYGIVHGEQMKLIVPGVVAPTNSGAMVHAPV